MTKSIIECRNVWFSYNGQTVLEDIDFDIPEGDFVAVMGPNGSGKTTLLKLILGLLTPTRGTLKVLDLPPAKASHHIGYVPQIADTNPHFPISVLDVVVMGGFMPGPGARRSRRKIRYTAHEVLEQMGIDNLADRRIYDLSGGQRQRVFIARALINRPRILLLDEPTAGIDSQGQNELYHMLQNLNAHTTIVMVSHDMMAVSTHVKSVACVNRRLHYHDHAEITPEMLTTLYPYPEGETCPVELVAHGVPHRVLSTHEETEDA